MRKPRIVIFFGGQAGNHDLSMETGQWMCHYIPRERYQVTPVQITTAGRWKVPLGNLPQSGPVRRMMTMLGEAVPAVSPQQGLERLLRQPVAALFTVVRGSNGDDGTLQSLAQTLGIPAVGSPPATCQMTSDKEACARAIEDIVAVPHGLTIRSSETDEGVIGAAREYFTPPFFVKPAAEEGSVGVERVTSLEELLPAVKRAQTRGNVFLQEAGPGDEIAVTLTQDERGRLITLPSLRVSPTRATYFDHLAKRRSGRAELKAAAPDDNPLIEEAEEIARDVYQELGCRGVVTIDMLVGETGIHVLDVNEIPTFSEFTPLKHQLQAAGMHPARFIDGLLRNTIDR